MEADPAIRGVENGGREEVTETYKETNLGGGRERQKKQI
jgi:hypothetical protein